MIKGLFLLIKNTYLKKLAASLNDPLDTACKFVLLLKGKQNN